MTALDPRIARGTIRMLAARQDARARGGRPLGWKAGFGAPAALSRFAIDRPVVGFLTRDRLLPDGATVDVSSWTRPVLEAEVAAHLGRDLGPGATPAEALAAVAGWSVAIELADVDTPPLDVEEVVAGNIYHRHVVLGPTVASGAAGSSFIVLRDGVEVARTDDPEALTGELGFVLASIADTLAACGGGLAGGEVVITGSVVPPLEVASDQTWRVVAGDLGALELRLV